MSSIKLMIVDDHDMFRSGIAALLRGMEDFDVIGIASNGEAAIEIMKKTPTDVVIMDVKMPILDGVGACLQMVEINPNVGVLALSWNQNRAEVINMVRAGARGYMVKDAAPSELVTAIKALAQGGSYFSKEVSVTLLGELENSNGKKHNNNGIHASPLTVRELEILEFISNEFTNKEIADQLYISPRTVETHRRNLIQKLKVKNTVGLVKYYFNFAQRMSKNSI